MSLVTPMVINTNKVAMTTGHTGDTEETQPVQLLQIQSEVREQDIELNENVAYGTVYQVCLRTQT